MKTLFACMTRSIVAAPIVAVATMVVAGNNVAIGDEIPVAEITHEGPVDFRTEILPLLRKSCLACHNETDAEADVVLENPADILKGNDNGPLVVAGNAAESFLLQVAAHQAEPVMPPEDNGVEAPNFTSEELGLLALWINEGAKDSDSMANEIAFERLPEGINPIYATALSDDGQILAASRANQIFLYHLPSQRSLGRLTDPQLIEDGVYENPGVAHLDLVQALAFSPDRRTLASSGYRTVKLWQQQPAAQLAAIDMEQPVVAATLNLSGTALAVLTESGHVQLIDTASKAKIGDGLETQVTEPKFLALSNDQHWLAVAGAQQLEVFEIGEAVRSVGVAGVEGGVSDLAWLAAPAKLVVAGTDPLLRVIDASQALAAGEASETPAVWATSQVFKGHGAAITALAVAENVLVSGDEAGSVIQWNVESGEAIRTLAHGTPVRALAIDVADKRLLSCGDATTTRLWNTESGEMIREETGRQELAIAVAHDEQASQLASRMVDLVKQDLDAAQKQKQAEEENAKKADEALAAAKTDHETKKTTADTAVAAKTDAEKLLADQKQKLETVQQGITAAEAQRVAAAEQAKVMAEKVAALQKQIADLQAEMVAADKERVAAETTQQTALKEKETLQGQVATVEAEIKKSEESVKTTSEAATKATDELVAAERALTSSQRTAERSKAAVERAVAEIPVREAAVAEAEAGLAASQQKATEAKAQFDNDRPPVTAASFVASAGLFTTQVGDQRLEVSAGTGHRVDSQAVASGRLVSHGADASGGVWSVDGTKLVCHGAIGPWKLVRTIGSVRGESPFEDRVTALDFSDDGHLLAAGGGMPSRSGEISVWNVETGELVRELEDPHSDVVLCVRFSPDGKQLASSASDRFMKTFNLETGELIRGFEGHTHHVQGVAWSADGRTLATCGSDQVVKIWNALTGDQIRTIQGFAKELTAIDFLGLGREVAISGGDKQVHIKNVDNGGNVRQLGGFPDYVYTVTASFDGQMIVGAGQDSVVRVWSKDGKVVAEFAPPQE